jgi:hypothetical protein
MQNRALESDCHRRHTALGGRVGRRLQRSPTSLALLEPSRTTRVPSAQPPTRQSQRRGVPPEGPAPRRSAAGGRLRCAQGSAVLPTRGPPTTAEQDISPLTGSKEHKRVERCCRPAPKSWWSSKTTPTPQSPTISQERIALLLRTCASWWLSSRKWPWMSSGCSRSVLLRQTLVAQFSGTALRRMASGTSGTKESSPPSGS